ASCRGSTRSVSCAAPQPTIATVHNNPPKLLVLVLIAPSLRAIRVRFDNSDCQNPEELVQNNPIGFYCTRHPAKTESAAFRCVHAVVRRAQGPHPSWCVWQQ